VNSQFRPLVFLTDSVFYWQHAKLRFNPVTLYGTVVESAVGVVGFLISGWLQSGVPAIVAIPSTE
jgi:hypothetical protein